MKSLASEVTVDRKIASAIAKEDEKIITAVNGMLTVVSGTSGSVTCSANANSSTTVSVTIPNGYKALSVVNIKSNGNVVQAYSNAALFGRTGSQTVTVWYSNLGDTKTVTFTVDVLCVKTIS